MGLLAVGLAGNVHRHHGEDGKGREKELHFFALDVALLDQVDVPAAKPARLDDAQRRRHTRG